MERSPSAYLPAALLCVGILAVGSPAMAGMPMVWLVSLDSRGARACPAAGLALRLAGAEGSIVSSYEVPLPDPALGRGLSSWTLEVPAPGEYVLSVIDSGCRDGKRGESSLRLSIRREEIPEMIVLATGGVGEEWHVAYLGIIRRFVGEGTLRVLQDPLRIENASDAPVRLCRRPAGAPVRVVERVGAEWREGDSYDFPEGAERIGPSEALALRERVGQVLVGIPGEGSSEGKEPAPTVRLLRVHVAPPDGSFRYLDDGASEAEREPKEGFCDSYYVEWR